MALNSIGRLAALVGMSLTLSIAPGCIIDNGDGFADSSWPDTGVKETRAILMDHVAQKPLHVATVNGSISVKKSTDASVSITADIRAQTDERLKATQVVAKRLDDGTLDIRVKWPDDKHKGNEGVSFEISIPDARDVALDASNGSITIANTSGKATLNTSNGSISLHDHDGAVKADSSNGGITLENISGEINADTSNGAIKMTNVHAPVKADTTNGSIAVALAPDSVGPVHLDSSNGSIKLSVGAAFTGTLKADTSNAGVKLSGIDQSIAKTGRHSATVRFTDSGPASVLSTSNAQIEIARN